MPRWAKELPQWLEKYKTESTISQADQATFCHETGRLGDRYLATVYLELPTPFKMSIYADFLEREIINRFCEQNALIPPLELAAED